MTSQKNKIIIGTVDKIDIPSMGFEDLSCKIDTGADTSSIHCNKVKLVEKDGKEYLSFRLLDSKHPLYQKNIITTEDFSEKTIKSSNGISETRYVIKTKVKLFGKIFPISFTLADRSKMTYPILLGKKFLRNRFLVDVSQKDLSFKQKIK
jgi:hypothetical protein